jgi:hypothetical protein
MCGQNIPRTPAHLLGRGSAWIAQPRATQRDLAATIGTVSDGSTSEAMNFEVRNEQKNEAFNINFLDLNDRFITNTLNNY